MGMGSDLVQRFRGFKAPSVDFQEVRDQRRAVPLMVEVDLSTARSIAAGTAALLNVSGNSFYSDPAIDSSGSGVAGVATVHFQDGNLVAGGTTITVAPQFIARVPFTQLLIENVAQAGKKLRIIYGTDIDFTPGLNSQVSVYGTLGLLAQVLVNANNYLRAQLQGHGDAETNALNAFAHRIGVAAVAANYSHIQVMNAGGSGKTVFVDRLIVNGYGANDIYFLAYYNTPLTNDGGTFSSKYAGQAAAAAKLRSDNTGGLLGTNIGEITVAAAGPNTPGLVLDPPIRLDAGKGVIFSRGTVNTSFSMGAEIREY